MAKEKRPVELSTGRWDGARCYSLTLPRTPPTTARELGRKVVIVVIAAGGAASHGTEAIRERFACQVKII